MSQTHEVTPELLRQIMPALPRVQREQYAPRLTAAMREFDITTELRAAAFLAQIAHESNHLTRWEESLNYSAKRLTQVWPHRFPTLASAQPYAHNPEALANKVYGGRMGNTEPGDGYKYRGRFPLQATGAGMYRAAAAALRLPGLAKDPDAYADDPAVGFRVSAWIFAVEKGCNALADRRQFRAITERINGGVTGLAERVELYERALRVLPDDFRLTASASAPADVEAADYGPDDLQVSPGTPADSTQAPAPAEISTADNQPTQPPPTTPTVGGGPADAPVQVPPVSITDRLGAGVTAAQAQIDRVKPAAFTVKAWYSGAAYYLTLVGGAVVTFFTRVGDWIAAHPDIAQLIAWALAGLALVCAVYIVGRMWLTHKREEQERAERREQAARAHELTVLQLQIAADPTKINAVIAPPAVTLTEEPGGAPVG